MTRALVLSEHDLDAWGERFARHEVPSALPYGADALTDLGWSLSGARRAVDPRWRRWRDVVEHRAGFPLERAIRGARDARRADVVLALLEQQGAAASVMRRAKLPPYGSTPLVVWSVWLADELRSAGPEQRRRLVNRYAGADLITHMSVHETEVFEEAGIVRDRTLAVRFGVNDDFYTPGTGERDIDLLAVGQDRGRDYATLFDAVRGTDLVLHLVCKPDNVAGLDVPDNVEMRGVVPLTEYRSLLRRARVVAVPTHDLAYPTGQSVALEAAASGSCVAVTGTRAMRDYFEDGVTGRLVEVGDVDGWRNLLVELREDEAQRARLGTAARNSAETRFSARLMWADIAAACQERGLT
ncbi:glycosyltransferase family 4 protein [Nocardioides zhouii]|uniref:Glycosyltransferase n=1 Tax=Nocardioides zhouii TaxID=1168729 RepID=A0A4Q2SKY2_9ACTN|nr:glycosyltransferase [Nocardioides zhouii]RYC05823.1 glycosyltransferase [Nocardioides zhouii]